jgi:lipase chaperone LimK
MPRRLLEDRQAPLHVQTVEQAVSQMRAKGANEQEVYQFRAQQFSPDAAHRLQALEQERLQWAARFAQYQAEVRLLLQLPEGPLEMPSKLSAAQQSAIEASRNRYFSVQEQRRLAAYEARAVGSINPR